MAGVGERGQGEPLQADKDNLKKGLCLCLLIEPNLTNQNHIHLKQNQVHHCHLAKAKHHYQPLPHSLPLEQQQQQLDQ